MLSAEYFRFARMCTNIDSSVNQPYHHSNTSDHIVNDNLSSPLLNPSWITSPGTFCCCNIPVGMSHYFHMSTEAAAADTLSWSGTDPTLSKLKILIQAMSTTQNLEIIFSLYGITHIDVVSEIRKYIFLVQVCDSYSCCSQTFWASRRGNEIPSSECLL